MQEETRRVCTVQVSGADHEWLTAQAADGKRTRKEIVAAALEAYRTQPNRLETRAEASNGGAA